MMMHVFSSLQTIVARAAKGPARVLACFIQSIAGSRILYFRVPPLKLLHELYL
jgi:hypothetical protein